MALSCMKPYDGLASSSATLLVSSLGNVDGEAEDEESSDDEEDDDGDLDNDRDENDGEP